MGRYSDQMLLPYHGAAGFKEHTTSLDAALAVTETLNERQREVMGALRQAGEQGLTPDEAAARIGRTVLAARPRFTELKLMGLIEKTGQRRANESGLLAAVWRSK